MTDLNAEAEQLPTEPRHRDWLGHKGMVQAAEYIQQKLEEEHILEDSFAHCPDKGTSSYDLVLVGHSLGAGTASILAILLRAQYPNLKCYAYSPPGGLLSLPAVEYTKEFITSVVLGKDVVPRIGLHQMEALRSDLINAIKKSQDPKWKIIMTGILCCVDKDITLDPTEISADKTNDRDVTSHPSDATIALTAHQPLYPPGRIIHIVRNHPKKEEKLVKKKIPVYQALWADNADFDEVLISPVMVQDHMPDKVLDALEKLLINIGPAKPQRHLSETDRLQLNLDANDIGRSPPHRIVLETSFTDLQPESEDLGHCSHHQVNLICDYTNVNREPLSNSQASDMEKKEWMQMAPLASPETLSDVSSISSKGSNKKINGNRMSWGLAPTMEPIAQSPAAQRPHSESLAGACTPEAKRNIIRVDSGTDLDDSYSQCFKITTEATVEVNAMTAEEINETRLHDISRLQLKFDSSLPYSENQHFECGIDGEYASTSTENPKMARDMSEDSMYNSGESFVPNYPEYTSQHEYGSHGYMYNLCDCNFSPISSPTMQHSASDSRIFREQSTGVHKFRNGRIVQQMAAVNEEPLVTSSPKLPLSNVIMDPELEKSEDSPTESSI